MMKKIIIIMFLALIGLLNLTEAGYSDQWNQSERYTIGCGDRLFISVWKEDGLTKEVTVLPDGTITFPLVGEIVAAGKTVVYLEQEFLKKIKRFMPGAVAHIAIVQVNSSFVYVIGKVNNPGSFPLTGSLDVMQALSLAKGLNIFADEKNIQIYRKTPGGKTIIIPFNYKDVSNGKKFEQNIVLSRGDLIVVP